VHQVGKYQILSELGHGAMGAVYKARDPLIGRLVALKTITSGVSAQPNSLERFYQEARSAGALQHPNIVTIYELGHENNTPFIAMEYIEGQSLDQLIEQRQILPLSLKLGYIVGVCEALSYAHRHDVIHRDIKPANIMVNKEGVVKVVDFGIARLMDASLTQANTMIGSRAYMAPQLYKGERADARTDIWAVGVTLYELIAYRRPFGGDSEAELMFHIMSDPPPALQPLATDCSDELANIVTRMLEKKPQERYQSMDDVLGDLEPVWKVAQQATVAGLLADSHELVTANDLQRAQGLLRKALQIDVTNTQAKSLLEKVTSELRRSQVLPKVNEHLERGRGFLQIGRLREARAEVEAAIGLDSRHEPTQKLLGELEAAFAREQEVEQKLRLTKQRLAEGALTEAAAALAAALEIDDANAQALELNRQIEEERHRREKRKKLSEVLHHARTLWTALNYEECLNVLSEALKEFPKEPELTKLQEMARHDVEDLQRQRQLGEVRKLLGQQKFSEARKIADEIAKKYPEDTTVKNLQTLALEGEREERNAKRLADELTALRALLSSGRFRDAVAKGDALLREYPEEFELKELVAFARGETTQLEQGQREKEIREFIERESYREAEAAALRAAQEFPSCEIFRKLAEDAGQKRRTQEQHVRAHEMLRRIDEIRGSLNQGKISDAIAFAQQTIATFGPDPNVTRLLNTANTKQEERRKKEEQEQQFAAAQTMVDAGNFDAATRLLNQAMATQIFERSDPRVQQRLREIEKLSLAPGTKKLAQSRPPRPIKEEPSSAEMNKSGGVTSRASSSPASDALFSESVLLGPAPVGGRAPGSEEAPAESPVTKAFLWGQNAWQFVLVRVLPAVRKPTGLAAVGGLVTILLAVTLVAVNHGPSRKEKELRDHALQLWSAHELDKSEQAWRQIEGLRGRLQKEAAQQIKDIENKRQQESQLFHQGERLLNEQKDYAGAAEVFEEVQRMSLWLAERASVELERARAGGSAEGLSKLEQRHFALGKSAFDKKAYEEARKDFQAALDLNVPNSTLRPEIERYLKKIMLNADAQKLYDSALKDIKDEKLDAAKSELEELIKRKAGRSAEAKQRLTEVTAQQTAQESFRQSMKARTYSKAKAQLDAMTWPKTKEKLWKELQSTELQEATDIRSRANELNEKGDLDGLERLQVELHNFAGRAEDPTLTKWAVANGEFDNWLTNAEHRLREHQGDKAEFEAAVKDFTATKDKGDLNHLQHEVMQRFQKIAKGTGAFRAEAQEYVEKTIPTAAQELITKNVGPGKIIVPPIECTGQGPTEAAKPSLQSVKCDQLDADAPLQWAQPAIVELPPSAKQPGKLPYTLHLTVTVDATGKVKVDKNGDVDNDFFKKAKDAAKHWKTTNPKSGGKPVSVTFPYSITFQ
jgi:serine/threonine-protein kinase